MPRLVSFRVLQAWAAAAAAPPQPPQPPSWHFIYKYQTRFHGGAPPAERSAV